MPAIPSFGDAVLQKLCDVLGDTDTGLTGTEIGRLLAQCKIDDPSPSMTKRYRLLEALRVRQSRDGCANSLLAFVTAVMDPVRYTEDRHLFEDRRAGVNRVLAFVGLHLRDDGHLQPVPPASTLDQAHERAGRLRKALVERTVHAEVLRSCREELLKDENFFHSVLEATKSVAQRIRDKTGHAGDGWELVEQTLSKGKSSYPRLAFNTLGTETDWNEQNGIATLIKGMFSTFRNPTAHAPKTLVTVTEEDALDLLSLASFLQRRLDRAVVTNPVPRGPAAS